MHLAHRGGKAGDAGDYTVLNSTFTAGGVLDHLDVSASVYNLLDDEYADPASRSSTPSPKTAAIFACG